MQEADRNRILEKMRQRMKEEKSTSRDPTSFKVPNTKPGETLKYRFVVLPGLRKGEKCLGGVASAPMDEWEFPDDSGKVEKFPYFCVRGGTHWIENRPYGCPRLFDGQKCPWCELGFELRKECDLEEKKKAISKLYLPRSVFAANIYFPPSNVNSQDLHGKVMWYQMPKTAYDKMEECWMRTDAGEDPKEDPKPFGMFWDPEDCMIFQLEVSHKGGYNNYENSKFLVKRHRLAETDEEIQAILDQRHDIVAKFPPRNVKELDTLLSKLGRDGASGGPQPTAEEPDEEEKPKTKANQPDEDDGLPSSNKAKKAPAATKPAAAPAPATPAPAPAAKSAAAPAPAATPAAAPAQKKKSIADEVDDPELAKLLGDVKDEM